MAILPWSVMAQDGRQRTAATVVADAMAQLPAAKQEAYNQVMGELAAVGADAVIQIADMLVPADKGKNAIMEYALDGLVAYTTAPGREKEAASVRKGLATAIDKCTDNPNKAFLLTLLQRCSKVEDAPVFLKYVNDKYLAEWAINGLVATPGTEDILLDLIQKAQSPCKVLAYAAGTKKLSAAEPVLLGWIAKADAETVKAIYHALGMCGTTASVKVLGNAAKAVNYEWESSDVTAAYLRLLQKLAATNDAKVALAAGKKLLKATDKANVRGAGLQLIFAVDGKKALPYLYAAMKDACREYRVNALRLSEPYVDEQAYTTLAKVLNEKEEKTVKADILNWFGTNHVASQIGSVVACMASTNDEVALAAIGAASKIGGETALNSLIAQLNGKHADKAHTVLLTFNGKVNPGIMTALDGDAKTQTHALQIASTRKMYEAADKVFALLNASNGEVSKAAYAALAGVVKASDFGRLTQLIEKANAGQVAQLQEALKSAIRTLSADEQSAMVAPCVEKSANPALYYPVLAQIGNKKAVAILMDGYKGKNKDAALKALLDVKSDDMIGTLYNVAKDDNANSQKVLKRYADLVKKSQNPAVRKVQLYSQALELATETSLQNHLVQLLGETNIYPALVLVEKYMDSPVQSTRTTAAAAVRGIVSKNIETLGGDDVRRALEKAIKCYQELTGDADAGYAIDDLKGMLEKLPAEMSSSVVKFELSPEEQKEGFEVLFDGVSMDKWTGNFINYAPQEDGTIYVSAQYGGSGNLYTIKEYSDFVLRFEFCFLREGVNNGIGIRTPMGVDAAYEGMEIQVLDHDAPIYKNLREYQQHGSVYGIIPAKRVKFPELGTWNVEEIRAVGDRITVTVNGEVILDGNIRKACKGNNVAKDGSNTNPYTVDKRNHPGLFNKSGHIGFLGHGEGLKYRNVRIKDLSKK